jgi:hypothetical protein
MPSMKRFLILVLSVSLISCNSFTAKKNAPTTTANPLLQLELKDSAQLTHIKRSFYKNADGDLYQRTFAYRQIAGADTLVSVEYFNGQLPQIIDPISFEPLDGWFAKDKNHAYYYRPTSGGMLIVELATADVASFKVLAGHYQYAVDTNHVYKETDILENLKPATLKIATGKDGEIIKLTSDTSVYNVE